VFDVIDLIDLIDGLMERIWQVRSASISVHVL
jgi:hypothetical protein